MNVRRVILIVATAIGLTSLLVGWINIKNLFYPMVPKDSEVFSEEVRKLEKMFISQPSEKAYKYFANNYHEMPLYEAYDLAHVVGTVLYKKHGHGGLQYCDSTYGGGCFRGFSLQEFLDKRNVSIEGCKDLSKEMMSHCVQGLGHGLLVAAGYTVGGIEQALASCEILHEMFPSCAAGVFTEYNTKRSSQLVRETRQSLTPDKENLYEPCNSLSVKYQTECFLDQPPRWFVHISTDPRKIVSLCEAIDDKSNRLACFRGIARITPHGITDTSYRLSTYCMLIADRDGQAICARELKGN